LRHELEQMPVDMEDEINQFGHAVSFDRSVL
jgi:hypothetical protein